MYLMSKNVLRDSEVGQHQAVFPSTYLSFFFSFLSSLGESSNLGSVKLWGMYCRDSQLNTGWISCVEIWQHVDGPTLTEEWTCASALLSTMSWASAGGVYIILILSCKSVVLIQAPQGPMAGSNIYFKLFESAGRSVGRPPRGRGGSQTVISERLAFTGESGCPVVASLLFHPASSPWHQDQISIHKDRDYRLKYLYCQSATALRKEISLKTHKKQTPCQSNCELVD